MCRVLGFDESLFYRLNKLESTISLNLQYRMNKTIMELANRLTYENRLKCANEVVSTATINIDFNVCFFFLIYNLNIQIYPYLCFFPTHFRINHFKVLINWPKHVYRAASKIQ